MEPFSRPPRSSFGHGAAGLAYFFTRVSAIAEEPGALAQAAAWAAAAEAAITEPDAFTGEPPVFPDAAAAPSSSLLFGEAGVWWVSALVHGGMGDRDGVDRTTAPFCAIAGACPDDRVDVAAGAAGLLLGTAALLDLAPARMRPVGDDLAQRLERVVQDAEATAWLGAAHGTAGIAYALLRWCQVTGTAPSPALVTLLDGLREARRPNGTWVRQRGSTEVWPGWCHGSAGWAHLWVLAATVLADERLLALAEPPAVHAIVGNGAGAGLCCGLTGQAYAAAAMYQATGETTWLAHARRLAAQAAAVPAGPELPRHSLWGGDLGPTLLQVELADPQRAAMPLYNAVV